MAKRVLVTGGAGFIGSHVAQSLVERGDQVVALDNLNDYYDPGRKRANLRELETATGAGGQVRFVEGDVRDRAALARLFGENDFDAVVHLAAMAGVRNSIADPLLYFDVNLNGTLALLDGCAGRLGGERAATRPPRFIFASTSSAYGATSRIPFVETDPCNRPLAPYAASKRAAELLGHTYHHLHGLSFVVLRFFTVYGPRGRPDMMAYKVAESIFRGQEVPLFNGGRMHRDWTYVSDIVAGVLGAVDHPLGHEVINLGRGEPVLLADFVGLIESCAGRKARLRDAPAPDADVEYTYADVTKARRLLGYDPKVSVAEGVARFWEWYTRTVAEGRSD